LKVHYCIHQYLPPVPVLNQINPVHTSPFPFLKIHFNIIMSCSFSTACIVSSPKPYEMFHNTGGVYSEEQVAPCPTSKLEKHCCPLSGAAYSIYLQLPSIYVGHSSILSMHHAIDREPLITDHIFVFAILCSDYDVFCIL